MSGEFSLRRGWIKTGSIVANADSGSSSKGPASIFPSPSLTRILIPVRQNSLYVSVYDRQGYLVPTSPHAESSIIRLAHWKVAF